MTWVKGHKGIEGNEEADKICREASTIEHESEGVVASAGLRAWSKRVRAEARGAGERDCGVSRRKDHNGGGFTKLGKKRGRR